MYPLDIIYMYAHLPNITNTFSLYSSCYPSRRFKPGTFSVSSIIRSAKHELTSKASSKNVLW